MKKHSRLIALLLGIFILLSAAACSGGGETETSAEETADTRTPETTDVITPATTEEPSVSASATPETTVEVTTEETAPPVATDLIRILRQKDRGEALSSLFADGEEKALLSEREERLLREHLLGVEVILTDNIASRVGNDILAAEKGYDLLLLTPEDGIALLTDSMLENLAEAGIDIKPESAGVLRSLTESLTVGGGAYLVSTIALTSDITSTYALRYDGTALSSSPVESALSGNFTAELMLSYLKEAENAFSLGESSPLTLYRGLGGKIFVKTASGIPTSAVTDDAIFKSAYTAASDIGARSADSKAIFTLEKIAALESGNIYLPIPKATADIGYSLPADHATLSLLAAPAGVVSGNRLKTLVDALILSSGSYRDAVRTSIVKNGAERSLKLLGIIEANSSLDLGILLGWGDIDDLIGDGLKKGTAADALLTDRMTEMRNKAVDVAAKIVADRLGIK